MDIYALLAAFGGGVMGTYMGGLPSFILVGIVAIAGSLISMAGGADVGVGFVAFGSYLGPQIAFVGGVAAAAFAAKKKILAGGADIVSSLAGLNDAATIAVGGLFGTFGYLVCYVYGTVLKLHTDTVALTVVTLGIVARLAFGGNGLLSRPGEDGKRAYISSGKALTNNLMVGLGVTLAVAGVYANMVNAGVSDAVLGNYPVLCFGIAATSLIFTQTGFATPGTHHIAITTASACVMLGNPVMGIVFGLIATVLGDINATTFNTNVDSHIDPPALTIFVLNFAINILAGNGFMG